MWCERGNSVQTLNVVVTLCYLAAVESDGQPALPGNCMGVCVLIQGCLIAINKKKSQAVLICLSHISMSGSNTTNSSCGNI